MMFSDDRLNILCCLLKAFPKANVHLAKPNTQVLGKFISISAVLFIFIATNSRMYLYRV